MGGGVRGQARGANKIPRTAAKIAIIRTYWFFFAWSTGRENRATCVLSSAQSEHPQNFVRTRDNDAVALKTRPVSRVLGGSNLLPRPPPSSGDATSRQARCGLLAKFIFALCFFNVVLHVSPHGRRRIFCALFFLQKKNVRERPYNTITRSKLTRCQQPAHLGREGCPPCDTCPVSFAGLRTPRSSVSRARTAQRPPRRRMLNWRPVVAPLPQPNSGPRPLGPRPRQQQQQQPRMKKKKRRSLAPQPPPLSLLLPPPPQQSVAAAHDE